MSGDATTHDVGAKATNIVARNSASANTAGAMIELHMIALHVIVLDAPRYAISDTTYAHTTQPSIQARSRNRDPATGRESEREATL